MFTLLIIPVIIILVLAIKRRSIKSAVNSPLIIILSSCVVAVLFTILSSVILPKNMHTFNRNVEHTVSAYEKKYVESGDGTLLKYSHIDSLVVVPDSVAERFTCDRVVLDEEYRPYQLCFIDLWQEIQNRTLYAHQSNIDKYNIKPRKK